MFNVGQTLMIVRGFERLTLAKVTWQVLLLVDLDEDVNSYQGVKSMI